MKRGNYLWAVLVVIFTVLTIAVNTLAEIVPLNGKTVAQISDSIHHYFVPAGYVFSIWGVIYIALIIFSVYQLLPKQRDHVGLVRIRVLYVLSCVANCLWIVLWHYGFVATSVIVMLVLLTFLTAVYILLGVGRVHVERQERWAVHAPMSIYLAWICVATVANISAALTVYQWSGWGIPAPLWGCIMIMAVLLVSIILLCRCRDSIFVCVVIWAVIGIGVHYSAEQNILATSIAVVTILAALTVMQVCGFFKPQK